MPSSLMGKKRETGVLIEEVSLHICFSAPANEDRLTILQNAYRMSIYKIYDEKKFESLLLLGNAIRLNHAFRVLKRNMNKQWQGA